MCFQIELQEAPLHQGIHDTTNKELMSLLTAMLTTPWDANHLCDNDDEVNDCSSCEVSSNNCSSCKGSSTAETYHIAAVR